jgi:hypothetical protein
MSATMHGGAATPVDEPGEGVDGVVLTHLPDLPMARMDMDSVPCADDATDFAREVTAPTASLSPGHLAALADHARGWIEEGRMAQGLNCDFSVEMPELGTLSGRLSITPQGADLELLASRPAVAAALRNRLPALQALVRRDSGGDVNLSVR